MVLSRCPSRRSLNALGPQAWCCSAPVLHQTTLARPRALTTMPAADAPLLGHAVILQEIRASSRRFRLESAVDVMSQETISPGSLAPDWTASVTSQRASPRRVTLSPQTVSLKMTYLSYMSRLRIPNGVGSPGTTAGDTPVRARPAGGRPGRDTTGSTISLSWCKAAIKRNPGNLGKDKEGKVFT